MSMLKAITFDLFGTLVDGGYPDVEIILQELVEDTGIPLRVKKILQTWNQVLFQVRSDGKFRTLRDLDMEVLPKVFEMMNIDADPEVYVDRLFQRFKMAKPYPEVAHVMRSLDGIPRALVSDADRSMVEPVLKNLGIDFDAVVYSEEVQCYKPDPRIFNAALEQLGISPKDGIHVGDVTKLDVIGAANAGMSSYWVNRDGATAIKCKPSHQGEDLTPLVDIVLG